jgi:hypothetical protein
MSILRLPSAVMPPMRAESSPHRPSKPLLLKLQLPPAKRLQSNRLTIVLATKTHSYLLRLDATLLTLGSPRTAIVAQVGQGHRAGATGWERLPRKLFRAADPHLSVRSHVTRDLCFVLECWVANRGGGCMCWELMIVAMRPWVGMCPALMSATMDQSLFDGP